MQSKKQSVSLKNVHDEVVETIIKSQPLNIGLNILCEKIGNMQQALPLHAKVACLAQGKMFVLLFEL